MPPNPNTPRARLRVPKVARLRVASPAWMRKRGRAEHAGRNTPQGGLEQRRRTSDMGSTASRLKTTLMKDSSWGKLS